MLFWYQYMKNASLARHRVGRVSDIIYTFTFFSIGSILPILLADGLMWEHNYLFSATWSCSVWRYNTLAEVLLPVDYKWIISWNIIDLRDADYIQF